MVTPPHPEPAPEHVRNALAMVSLILQTGERVPGPEGLEIAVPVATLEAIKRGLEAALAQLEPRT